MVLTISNNFQECNEELLYDINGGEMSTWWKAAAITLAATALFVAAAPVAIVAAPVAAVVGVTAAHGAILATVGYITLAATGH